jgi:hypothetical protein
MAQQVARAALEDKLITQQTAAREKVASIRADKAAMASSVAATVSGFDGGITGHSDTRTTFRHHPQGPAVRRETGNQVRRQPRRAPEKGLSAASLQSIANAGIEGGGVTAAALAKATPAQIALLNKTTAQSLKVGAGAGNTVASQAYDHGLSIAVGIEKGISSHLSKLEQTMAKVAKTLTDAFIKKMAIHSPSRVMHGLGVHVSNGLADGIMYASGGVQTAVDSLIATFRRRRCQRRSSTSRPRAACRASR